MGFATNSAARRWPGGIVPFVIHRSIRNNATSLAAVQGAIAHWNNNTCLQLVARRRQADFIEFREHGSACKSAVGRQGGRQLVSCDINSGNFGQTAIIHEIGHAIGLIHEQSRPDRDVFVVVSGGVLKNINYKKRSGLVLGRYDCRSVMHYPQVDGRINAFPGRCAGMGSATGLSAGDIAAVQHMYRFMRRGDSANRAGNASEIKLVNRSGRDLVTTVRTQEGRLRLITWRVNANGSVSRRGDSGNQAGDASHIDIARVSASRFVTSCRTGGNRLRLISWGVNAAGAVSRRGDSGNQAGEASLTRVVALSSSIIVSACRTSDGRLRLISWRLNGNGSLTRLADSANLAGDVSEISMAALPGNFPRRVATAVRTSEDRLRLIIWRVTSAGGITRRGDSANAAGKATLIRVAVDGSGRVLTSFRTAENNLRVISWRVSGGGLQVTRVGGSADQAGTIGDNSLVVHGGNRAISAVRRSDGKLRVIEWLLGPAGAVARNGDSANGAGTSSRISVCPTPVTGNMPVVCAIRTSEGRLRLISWARC